MRSVAIPTAAAAAAAAAAAKVTTRTATAAAATRTLFARAGNVDRQGAAIQLRAVQRGNGLLRLFRRAHGDEAEASGTAADAVHHQVGFRDRAVRREGVLQVVFRGVEGKIPYKQFITHVMFNCETNLAFVR